MLEILFIAFLSALFSTDTTAFGQFMISRPIFCAPIIGYVLGDVKTGLWIGMIVELMWVNIIPMGAAIPQDSTAIALLSTIWGVTACPGHKAAMVLAMMLAVPAGTLFKQLDILLRYYNVRIVHWVEAGIQTGKEDRIAKGVYAGLFLFFFKAFVFYALLIYPGQWLVQLMFVHLNDRLVLGLESAWRILPLIGFGLFLTNFRHGKFPYAR
jgi:mannose/fructose/N-acetylgalactosamine-specific phosphotransferase system component IIC